MTDPIINFKTKTAEVLEVFKKELGAIRTSRPTPIILEGVRVEYYGKALPLNQIGSIAVEPPRDIVVHVWDGSAVPAVLKAIETSSLGLSASPQGNVVRVHLPELSSERREELTKLVGRLAEDHRIRVRHFRDETNKEVETLFKAGDLSEDAKFKFKEMIQEETEKINKSLEDVLAGKIKEIKE